MSLKTYEKKRNFDATPEPKAEIAGQSEISRFVVQRHDASRLHYDLRLEMGGVLKSWAVPKGPSMNPADKRLAIHTEDHPVKYLDFEGTIPKGNYGAGEMKIWDRGTFTAAKGEADLKKQYAKKDLKICFNGKKLKGNFALVQAKSMEKENHWLLIKKKDDFAVALYYDAEALAEQSDTALPDSMSLKELVKPMLADKAEKSFDGKDWIYEIKWDGYRALANIEEGAVQLYSRNGHSFNRKFEPVVDELQKVPYNVIFDGEIVALNTKGIPDFQLLQDYPGGKDAELRYYIFDLLYLNGHSIMHLPLGDRKNLLEELLDQIPGLPFCEHVDATGKEFFEVAVQNGYEGIIAKKMDSKYYPGTRSKNWLKIKARESQEALICGYTEGERVFGSLILGVYEGNELDYIGNCGTGFDGDTQKELMRKMQALSRNKSPFSEKINLKGRKAHWVKPELICEVFYSEWTNSGNLRHPVFKGLRNDKMPSEIKKTGSVKVDRKSKKGRNSSSQKEKREEEPLEDKRVGKVAASPNKREFLEVEGISVPVSNLDKVLWPEEGYTKFDLINYYLEISETILPYLKDRPQNMNRHPDGIDSEGFYQKDSGDILPDWIETIGIYSESSNREIEYMLCQKTASLLYMANLGCIEINPWNSRTATMDNPDYTVIDLDPAPKTTFEEVIEATLAVKEVLDMAGLKGYCKTSGSRGMHVYLPLAAKYNYDEARDFTKLLCHYVQEMLPKLTTLERSKKKRNGRIYLDYLQNRPGQTLAAAYCLRPKKGATVSAPLMWDEVSSKLDMREFNIETMPERIKNQKGEPFKGVLGKGINIEKALTALEENYG